MKTQFNALSKTQSKIIGFEPGKSAVLSNTFYGVLETLCNVCTNIKILPHQI